MKRKRKTFWHKSNHYRTSLNIQHMPSQSDKAPSDFACGRMNLMPLQTNLKTSKDWIRFWPLCLPLTSALLQIEQEPATHKSRNMVESLWWWQGNKGYAGWRFLIYWDDKLISKLKEERSGWGSLKMKKKILRW